MICIGENTRSSPDGHGPPLIELRRQAAGAIDFVSDSSKMVTMGGGGALIIEGLHIVEIR